MKAIKMNLSVASIEHAINEIKLYQRDLNQKIELFCQRLVVEVGAESIQRNVSESPLGHTVMVTTQIDRYISGCRAMLIATGKIVQSGDNEPVNTLLLIEFGSGIKYNSATNPKAGEFGMGPGSYPGNGHWDDPNGWYYLGDDGEWHHSYGVKATMPMYNAGKEMSEQVVRVAREVFAK